MTNLIKARDIYRQGWKPDWKDSSTTKYIIAEYHTDGFRTAHLIPSENTVMFEYIFSFQSKELAHKFFNNFKEELKKFYEIN